MAKCFAALRRRCTRGPQRRCRYDDAGHSQSRRHNPHGEAHGGYEARLGGHRLVRRCEGRPRSDASASLGARPGAGTRSRTTMSPCGVASCSHPRHSHSIACEGAPRGSACCVEVSDGGARQGAGAPLRSPVRAPFLHGSQRTETHVGGSILLLSCSFSLRLVSMLPRRNRKAWACWTKLNHQLAVKRTRHETGQRAQWKLSD